MVVRLNIIGTLHYRNAVNYRPEVEPKFRSTPTSFFVTLYNLNYNVPVEKVLITPQQVSFDSKKVLITPQNLSIEDLIDRLNSKKSTKEKAKKLFAFMNFNGIFGRKDIMELTDVSITAAGNLLNILKSAGLIAPVSGHGNGKYKFVKPQ